MNHRPLVGYRVIEVGTMVAAPFASHILAQLGAEVIKVEPPTGDTTRALVRGGPSGTFIAYNHDKRSVAINLRSEAGQDAFRALVATSDVLVHNLAPGAARRLNVTASSLAEVNPKLITCQIRGYAAGPQEDDLATNPVAEAATGVMDDHRVNGRPTRLGPSYHDQFAGSYAVIRILAALLEHPPAAEDRHIDIGLYETGLHLAARDLAGLQLKTQLLGRPEREGGGEFSMPGYGAYETRDKRWIYLLVLTDAHWQNLTAALQMPEGNDRQLDTLRQRKKQREQVEAAVRTAIGTRTYDDAAEQLTQAGAGFTEVLPLDRVLETDQAHQPGKLSSLSFGGYDFEVPEFPGASAATEGSPPPHLGEHTEVVLTELGYDQTTTAMMISSGAVAAYDPTRPTWHRPS